MKRPSGRVLLASGIFVCFVSACVTQRIITLAPPMIPDAEFIGTAACADCHEDMVSRFEGATHAQLSSEDFNVPGSLGCEACHGAGSLHADSGGEVRDIINPGGSPQVCFNCHQATGAEFRLPHSHPVMEGKMACTDCHDPHEGRHGNMIGIDLTRPAADQKCLECHQAQRGPFIFEHEASQEGCLSCHQPHGSVNNKMLNARSSNLCLSCHFQQQTAGGQVRIGTVDHSSLVRLGTCWSAGCHEAVHGSHVNSHLRY